MWPPFTSWHFSAHTLLRSTFFCCSFQTEPLNGEWISNSVSGNCSHYPRFCLIVWIPWISQWESADAGVLWRTMRRASERHDVKFRWTSDRKLSLLHSIAPSDCHGQHHNWDFATLTWQTDKQITNIQGCKFSGKIDFDSVVMECNEGRRNKVRRLYPCIVIQVTRMTGDIFRILTEFWAVIHAWRHSHSHEG